VIRSVLLVHSYGMVMLYVSQSLLPFAPRSVLLPRGLLGRHFQTTYIVTAPNLLEGSPAYILSPSPSNSGRRQTKTTDILT